MPSWNRRIKRLLVLARRTPWDEPVASPAQPVGPRTATQLHFGSLAWQFYACPDAELAEPDGPTARQARPAEVR